VTAMIFLSAITILLSAQWRHTAVSRLAVCEPDE
jgi:hypothetical protein